MTMANDHILETAARWQRDGARVALAVVIQTWGSSPRQPGSLMAIRGDGQIAGSVSGGCVESSVIESARRLLDDGGTEQLDFGVADETAWRVGLSCGGKISVFVCPDQAMADNMLAEAAAAIGQRQPVRLDCRINDQTIKPADNDAALANTIDAASSTFRLEVLARPRLYIIGAVHISQHLAPMAISAGFAVTVIDPRTTFANAERFPGIELVSEWPDEALTKVVLDDQTAVITLTHDPKIDDNALIATLPHPVFLISSLGSRRSHSARCDRLRDEGFSEADLARIHGPAGLDIGAQTPAEIAVSVLAEVIAAFRGRG